MNLIIKPEDIVTGCTGYFDNGKGYACSESILLGFQDMIEINSKENIIPQIATAFGGGIGGQGLLCGALQSSIMLLSLKYGRSNNTDDRTVLYEKTEHLMNKFKKKYGTLYCRGIRVIPEFIDDPDKLLKMKSVYHEIVCSELVGNVAEWLLEELDRRE